MVLNDLVDSVTWSSRTRRALEAMTQAESSWEVKWRSNDVKWSVELDRLILLQSEKCGTKRVNSNRKNL